MGIDALLALLSQNPIEFITKITELLAAGKITADVFKKLSKKFREQLKKKEFGCTPSDKLADNLRNIDSTPKYVELKKLIGKHPTLRLARIGLYLETLNKEGATKIVDEIRSEIVTNHGTEGLQFLDIGSSGLMSEIIDSLNTLKEEWNLPRDEVVRRYEYIIKRFRFLTEYINNDELPANIELRLSRKLLQYPEQFYVIATGQAANKTMETIAKMNTANTFRERGYTLVNPRVQNFGATRKQYIWIFVRFL